jgi:hypothetical protein
MGDPVFDLGDTDNRSTELTGQAVSGCSITTDISWGLFKTDFWESGLSSGPVDADERDLPQTRWWFSQSLCWQNEPQYLAMLQPLHVSLAFLPQFQQLCNDIMKSTINTVNQIVNQISTPIRGLNYTLKYTINTVKQSILSIKYQHQSEGLIIHWNLPSILSIKFLHQSEGKGAFQSCFTMVITYTKKIVHELQLVYYNIYIYRF